MSSSDHSPSTALSEVSTGGGATGWGTLVGGVVKRPEHNSSKLLSASTVSCCVSSSLEGEGPLLCPSFWMPSNLHIACVLGPGPWAMPWGD